MLHVVLELEMQRYKWLGGAALVPTIDDGDYVLHYDAMVEIGRLTALACERQEIIEEQAKKIAARDNLIALQGMQLDNRQMVIGAIEKIYGARR